MAREQSGAASPERARFVGRAVELARLEELLDDAVRGSARAAMLVGEPGIGKSSTAVEVAARARERGMLVLEGCGYEGEGAPPLWQWVQVLRAAAEEGALASLEGLDPFTVAVVATLVREVARTVPSLPEVPRLEPAAERFRLLDAAGRLLRALARTRP
jgi:predicted ATPase